jgi:uncharacterized membrane protein YesL
MSGIFAPDSAAMRFLTRIADLMILNLVFIATAIPIVTLGAALTALNFTAMRIVRGQCDAVTRDYFRSFRQNFRQATLLGLLVILVTVALGAWYVVLTGGSLDAGAQLTLLVLWYLIAFAFALNLLFVFPYLANFEGTIREVLRNARLLSWRHPLVAIMSLAIIGLAIVVTVFYPAVTAYGLLWLAIGFAAIAFLTGVLFTRVFDTYAPQPVTVEDSDEE